MQLATLATLTHSARAAIGLATKGLPAVRAALWGARIGAGPGRLDASVIERLGVEVVREVPALAKTGARAAMVLGRDGVAVKIGAAGGATAVVTESSVRSIALASTRTAFAGVVRAARQGAVAGAIVDGAFGAVEAIRAVRDGQLSRRDGALLAGKRTARGAVVGGVSVAAAGAASAVIAATGIAVAGAPVIVPLVTMAAAGLVATRGFDRLFGE